MTFATRQAFHHPVPQRNSYVYTKTLSSSHTVMANLPPLTPTQPAATGNPAQTAAPEARELARLLSLPVGSSAQAIVSKISALSPAERTWLLEKAQNAIQAANPRADTTSQRGLAREITLSQAPATRLLEVTINGKSASALSDLPLKTGQAVTVRLHPSGQLQLMKAEISLGQTTTLADLGTPAATAKTPPPTSGTTTGSNPVNSAGATNLPPVIAGQKPSVTAEAKQALIQQAMMSALPRAEPLAQLLNTAAKMVLPAQSPVARAEQSQPMATGNNTNNEKANHTSVLKVTESIVNLLQKVEGKALAFAPLAQQTPQAVLKTAVAQSGVFYENHIKQAGSELPKNDLPKPELNAQDTKQLLIHLTNATETLRANLSQITADKPLLDQLFRLLLPAKANQLLTPAGNQPQASPEQQVRQMITQLAQTSKTALARVQLQQLMTLTAQIADAAQPATAHTWYVDLPVRLFHGFGNVHLHIQERELPQKEGDEKKRKQKKKSRWRLYMELEMGESGNLAVEVSLLDKRLNAQFWADKPNLRQAAREQLKSLKKNLEEQGLTVTDLRCHNHPPQPQPVKMDYSIVDIRT